ncbi:MAG: hypothetical protein RMI04_05855 [Thermofilaceae archaeon]|nr:hypothetical protein [Thermofilaceae archaeon]
MEELKLALKHLLVEEKEFLRELILAALSDGGAERLVNLLLSDPRAKTMLASELADVFAIPLGVATKEDVERLEKAVATKDDLQLAVKRLEDMMATKEDLKAFATKDDLQLAVKRLEDMMATKDQLDRVMVSLEDEAREWVEYLLGQRGIVCKPQRLWLDEEYEFDIYCVTDGLTVVGEAKVRVGSNVVEKLVSRVNEASKRWPSYFKGKVVKVLYCMIAPPSAVEKAEELGVWLIESTKELTRPPYL